MSHFIRFLNTLLIAITLVVLTACGGSSGGGSAQTGQLSVVITDGPTDIYERVLITLTRMTLIGSGGQQVVYDGEPITFDLLQLRDRADFAFSQQIAVGDYNKIRLEVTDVTLVDLGDVANPDDVEVVLDQLPANGKIDLNPRGPFTIVAGRATVVELDIDARRSFQVVQTGQGPVEGEPPVLKFRPVIFVNVYDDDIVLPNRMTRVFGTVEEIDTGNSSVLLCNLQFVAQLGDNPATEMDSCVRVHTDSASHFGEDGLPLNDLAAVADADPAEMTAIGFPSLPDAVTADNVVLHLDAVVTELGARKTDMAAGWETTPGTIQTDLTPPIDCVADPCVVVFQPEHEASPLTVQLQPETQVFTRNGTRLDIGDLGMGVNGAFDGIRVAEGSGEEMRASLFITGPNAGDDPVLISGTLTSVAPGNMVDYILTVVPEGGTDMFVCVTSETDILQILVEDETVTIVDLLDPDLLNPADGPHVEAAGEIPGDLDDAACDLSANVVIVE